MTSRIGGLGASAKLHANLQTLSKKQLSTLPT